jgi:hypothetical protein
MMFVGKKYSSFVSLAFAIKREGNTWKRDVNVPSTPLILWVSFAFLRCILKEERITVEHYFHGGHRIRGLFLVKYSIEYSAIISVDEEIFILQ